MMSGFGRPPTWGLVLFSLKQVALVAFARGSFNRACRDFLEPGKNRKGNYGNSHGNPSCHNQNSPRARGASLSKVFCLGLYVPR